MVFLFDDTCVTAVSLVLPSFLNIGSLFLQATVSHYASSLRPNSCSSFLFLVSFVFSPTGSFSIGD